MLQDGDPIPDEAPVETSVKQNRLSDEALAKLAIAREKANARRRELAASRRADKENAIQSKMSEINQQRLEKQAKVVEREAKKRVTKAFWEHAPEEPTAPPPKPKRRSIVLERDGSSSEEDVVDARVYYVNRRREREPSPQRPPPPEPDDPTNGIYHSMFGGSNYLF